VLDRGPGVSDEERELIFRRFWRKDRLREGSAGLGLSIVQRITEAHGGTVNIERRVIGGTKATLAFKVLSEKVVGEAPSPSLV
jgi:signal transduction histidine kinase